MSENNNDFLLIAEDITFSYPDTEISVLDKISFRIKNGEYVSIVGTNGSGKSTLARLIGGFLEPVSGKFSGSLFFPLSKDNVKKTKQYFSDTISSGIVFQSPRDQIVAGIVQLDTAFGPENLGLSNKRITDRVFENLTLVNLLEKSLNKTDSLSSGEKQKLVLAGILALHPQILILDETTSMIDPETRRILLDFLDKWNFLGKTIIHITHNMDEVKHSNHVLVLFEGKKVFDGTPASLFIQPDLENWGLLTSSEMYNRIEKIKNTVESKQHNKFSSISLEQISYGYDKDKNIFSDFSLLVEKGTLTAVIGNTGSGKSTLLEICAGLLRPVTGSIYADQYPVLAVQESECALFEEFVGDDIAYGLQNKGFSGNDLEEKVHQVMDLVNLSFNNFVDRRTFSLSGGEKRKVALAGIIVLDSSVLLFDEPTSALDPVSRCRILEILAQLCQSGKTIIFSTHYIEETQLADRVIILEKGEIVADGTPDEVCHNFTLINSGNNKEKKLIKSEIKLLPLPGIELVESLQKANTMNYYLLDTPIHRLLPVWKYLILIGFLICGIFSSPIMLCFIILTGIIYSILAHYPLGILMKNIIKIIPWVILFFLFQVFFFPVSANDNIIYSWGVIILTDKKFLFGLEMLLHFIALLIPISVFVYTTEETEILYGMEDLLTPLKYFGIPVYHFALIVCIVFRFIPLLINESIHILKAQLIRGSFFNKKGIFRKIRALLPVFIPLIIQTLNRAVAFGDALDARYYNRGIRRRWIPDKDE